MSVPSRLSAQIGFPLCVLVALWALRGPTAWGQESLVTNGDFSQWENDRPQGWKVEIGARNGADAPVSEVKPIAGPALMLRGNAATMAWHSVSQELPVDAGGSYRLNFTARSKDLKREGRQRDNCYAGWFSFDTNGKVIDRKITDLSTGTGDWKRFEVDYTIPAQADSTVIIFFLSKTGLIGIKQVEVTPAPASENLLRNGSFRAWSNGRPDSWQVEIGARNGGNAPRSKVSRLDDQGITLSGNAQTVAWQSVGQDVQVRAGKTYALRFEALAEKIRREGRQFNNCYVGVLSFDANEKRLDMKIEDLSGYQRWRDAEIKFSPPGNARKTSVLIFLSQSGTLHIKNVRLQEVASRTPFR
ncbi:MAG: hypothetical protein MI861_11320 [Pirellulales bacterium]|nr:hypothetical protein [Pirellulales bacterium]